MNKKKPTLQEAIQYAKSKGYTIAYVTDRTIADYGGMNDLAAKELGYPEMKDKHLHIPISSSDQIKAMDIVHEVDEREVMSKQKKKNYWNAHRKVYREVG